MYSCECGNVEKPILNDVLKDLLCPICRTGLKPKTIAKQCKLDSYLALNEDTLGESRNKIYGELLKGEGTDQELAKRLGFNDPNKIRPRRNELVKMDLVKESYKRQCNITGKTSTVWRAN